MSQVRTYQVEWRGSPVSVEATVDGTHVQLFSMHPVSPHGYVMADDADRVGDRARGGQTYHSGETQGDDQKTVAFSAWPEADRLELARLVH